MAPRPDGLTAGAPHVRDVVDLSWVMRTVLVALAPCFAVGVYNAGYQANRARLEHGLPAEGGWRGALLGGLGAGGDPTSVSDCLLLGLTYVAPLLLVALAVGAAWERLFEVLRRRTPAPGLAVTAAIFTACVPPTIAWWQVAVGMSVALVVGREIFGGTGRNVFNPAVVGLTVLTFAYPSAMRGDRVWVAGIPAGGAAEPTLLRAATTGGADALDALGASWLEAFLGRVPGAVAETSALACLVGGAWLVLQRVASWRVVLGVLFGAAATGTVLPGPPASWHLVLGMLAFGAVFLATDPVTSATTETGRWIYGALVGFLAVLIRVANPVHVEGVLFAVLFGNVAAPLIDRAVAEVHVRRRRRRLARS